MPVALIQQALAATTIIASGLRHENGEQIIDQLKAAGAGPILKQLDRAARVLGRRLVLRME